MTVPEITPEVQRQAEASVAGPAAEVLERLAEKLGSKASVSAVFGEPVARAGITIIPVARVGFGFGAGAGRGRKQAEGAQGGGGAAPRPLRSATSRSRTGTPCSSPSAIRWWMWLSRWPRWSRGSPHRGWSGVCSGAGDAARCSNRRQATA
jgi:hypothetical protein